VHIDWASSRTVHVHCRQLVIQRSLGLCCAQGIHLKLALHWAPVAAPCHSCRCAGYLTQVHPCCCAQRIITALSEQLGEPIELATALTVSL
jgi:hypothetical protein